MPDFKQVRLISKFSVNRWITRTFYTESDKIDLGRLSRKKIFCFLECCGGNRTFDYVLIGKQWLSRCISRCTNTSISVNTDN